MIDIIMILGDVYDIHVGDRTILDVDGFISFTLSQKPARQVDRELFLGRIFLSK